MFSGSPCSPPNGHASPSNVSAPKPGSGYALVRVFGLGCSARTIGTDMACVVVEVDENCDLMYGSEVWGTDEGCLQTTTGKEKKMGVKMRSGVGPQEEYRVQHVVFADHCYLFATSNEEIRMMITYSTDELRQQILTGKKTKWNLWLEVLEEKSEMFFWRLTKISTQLRRLKAFSSWGYDHDRSCDGSFWPDYCAVCADAMR